MNEREMVEIRLYRNGKRFATKNKARAIRRRGGKEFVVYGGRYREVIRVEGRATVEINYQSITLAKPGLPQ